MVQNKGLIFKKVPMGLPKPGEHLTVGDRPIDLESTPPPKNGLLTENFHVFFDRYQRGRMRPAEVKSYAPGYELGKPILNGAVCKVLKSGTSKFKDGEVVYVSGACPTEDYSLLPAEIGENAVGKIENKHGIDKKVFIGPLGMLGLMAYGSFYGIGQPKKGDAIFISADSRVVGVGEGKKLEFLVKEPGFDGGFNYKKEKPADAL